MGLHFKTTFLACADQMRDQLAIAEPNASASHQSFAGLRPNRQLCVPLAAPGDSPDLSDDPLKVLFARVVRLFSSMAPRYQVVGVSMQSSCRQI